MKRILFLILILSLLFGCMSAPEPAIKVIIQEVKVPVREVCIQQSSIPKRLEYITVGINKGDTNTAKTKKLIIYYNQSGTYIKTLETILKGCSE